MAGKQTIRVRRGHREYVIGATLKVIAEGPDAAKEYARNALLTLESATIVGAWIDHQPELFDSAAFAQMPGQTSMETD